MFALITTLSTNLLRTYIIYRFMRLFFWTDIEEKKKERACYVLFFVLTAGVHLIFFSKNWTYSFNFCYMSIFTGIFTLFYSLFYSLFSFKNASATTRSSGVVILILR